MNLLKKSKTTRAIFFIIGDFLLSFVSLYTAYLLRFNFHIPVDFYHSFTKIFFVFAILKILFLYTFRLYFVSWRYFSLLELKELTIALIAAYIYGFMIIFFFRNFFLPYPRSAILIDFVLSFIFIGFFRISKRLFLENNTKNKPPAIIIGVSDKAATIFKQDFPFNVVGVFDESKETIGSYFFGFKVRDIKSIPENIKTAIITKQLPPDKLNQLFELLKDKNIEDIKIYNPFSNIIRELSIEDLLSRKPRDLDQRAISEFVKDKTILITGGGGSIGSELVRQCVFFKAKKVVVIEASEFNLYKIKEELPQIEGKLVNVVDKQELERVFKEYSPDIVIHAAAYKHVPLCEENPRSAVINNIIGTKNTIELAEKYNCKKFVLISTDKAVRPTSVMGATKRLCELYAQNFKGKTEIVSVRFGNVLNSSGSVVPKFKKLIEEGKPLTVTHPEVKRYFMLIPEACKLVLQAASIGKGGEIFILDMGEPVKIVELAKKMLKIYGKDESQIVFTGLREGEKLFEELLVNEADRKTQYESILVAKTKTVDIGYLEKGINELVKLHNKEEILLKLKELGVEIMTQKT
ncbi:polysaccharide biosynthesis protein [Hippea jasoniae]|uniref:polysaccharide biosynthesis protein n=1 Tax=Hippea jasoniae TaxID=944479 RepID=UPI0005518F5A|nr:nucleoside-diphosphate sugar epimerase/dehydratase [Hippea jasoniae]